MAGMVQMRVVHLPAELCVRAEKRFADRFDSVEQLLEYMLEELLRNEAAEADAGEQRLVEQRLRELGYL
jgi:hypothetical protein